MERWLQFSQLNVYVKNQCFSNPQPTLSFGGSDALPKFTVSPAQLRSDMVVAARPGNERNGQDRDCMDWCGCCKESHSCLLGAAGFAVRAGFSSMD